MTQQRTGSADAGGESRAYRVLVALGDDEATAMAQAGYVAALPVGATPTVATLTHVLHGEELETTREFRTAGSVGTVRHAREWLRDRGIDVEVRDVEYPYPPTRGIVSLADAVDADAIVLGGRKRGAVQNVLFGSVVRSVLKATTRPVVVVDPAWGREDARTAAGGTAEGGAS